MGYNSNWQVSLSSFVYRKCKRKGSNLNRYTVTIKMYPVNQGTRDNSLVKVTKSEVQTWSSERQTGRFVVQRTSACVSILSFTLLSLSLFLSLSLSLLSVVCSCLAALCSFSSFRKMQGSKCMPVNGLCRGWLDRSGPLSPKKY